LISVTLIKFYLINVTQLEFDQRHQNMKQRTKKPRAASLKEKPPTLASRVLFVCLCASIGLETLFFYAGVGNAFTVPKTVALLIGAALILPQIGLLLLRQPLSKPMRFLLLLAAFQLAALTFSTILSISPAVSFWGGDWRRMGWIAQFSMLAIALAVPLAVGSEWQRWTRLLQFIAVVGFVSAGYGILQWLDWDPLLPTYLRQKIITEFAGAYRSSGTIGQPAYFANFLLYPMFSSLALVFLQRGVWRIVNVCGMAVLIVGMGTTGSRNGMLGFAAGVSMFWVLTMVRRGSLKLLLGMLVAILVCGLLVQSLGIEPSRSTSNLSKNGHAIDYLRSRVASAGTDSASIGRMVLWTDVVHRILPNVWLSGTGPGMFRVAFTRYRSNSYTPFDPDVHWENAHNMFWIDSRSRAYSVCLQSCY
jgi:hypothetical protein